MQKFFAPLLSMISKLLTGKKPPPAPTRCQFCGETGHATDDCPKSAKFKLFHVDRE
jgi:hypothetical protein